MNSANKARRAFTVLIPARMASTRLPNKPLADIQGLPMIVRVALQARKSDAENVVVATDDARIQAVCDAHQVASVMTQSDHPSGSDRLAEAAQKLGLADDSIVVNVQGDEPFISPALINATAQLLTAQTDAVMGTAAHALDNWDDFQNPNVVKVVLNGLGQAQYFSREPIPHKRGTENHPGERHDGFWGTAGLPDQAKPLRHIGIYSYTAHFLQAYPRLPVAPTETLESLEQLRVLWHGHKIAVHISQDKPAMGIDTPEDLARAQKMPIV